MKWKAVLLCLLGFALLPGRAHAQATGRITGVVTEASSGQPLAAATVTVGGSTLSATTDAQGRYTLAGVPAGSRQVSAARLGFGTGQRTVTVAAGGTATADFALATSTLMLQEMVVVGYGSQERRDITGSVGTVNLAALEDAPVQSMDQLLQGTVAGVQVTQASSAPGGGISIRVRGSSSISGTSEPLYVIDGFPIENDPELSSPGSGGRVTATVPSNPLAALNPNDIESIQILKDASSTAIYGARGANGVVIVTTRRGRAGRPEMSFDVFTGTQSVANRYELLNSRELAQAMNEASIDGGGAAVFQQSFLDTLGAGTDWQDEIFRDAPVRSFQGSVSGGTAGDFVTRYAVSGGYYDQTGVVLGSSFERYSLRASLDQGFGERLRFGSTLSGSRVNSTFIPTEGESNARAGAVGAAIQAYPFLPVRLEDGRYPYQGRDLGLVGVPSGLASNLVNPVSLAAEVTDRLGDTRVLGNAFGEWEPFGGLRARVAIGADFSSRFRDTYYPRLTRRGEETGGEAIRGRSEVLSYLNENTLAWSGRMGSAHELDLLGGYSWQSSTTVRTGMSATGFVTDITTFDDIESGTVFDRPTSERDRWVLQSYLGRANYRLLDRYLLTLTGRYDGSSRFGANNKFAFFPSAAVAWRVSDEPFMQGVDALDELKLRVSYGRVGNPGIRSYQSLARLTSTSYSFGGNVVSGYFPVGVANDDLGWESTTELDVGLDLAFWDRVGVTADWYSKRTDDLLLLVDLPSESGFARGLLNAGSIENRGVEVSLNLDVLRGDDDAGRRVGWRTTFNYARNRNEVVDLGGDDEIRASTISDDFKLGGTVVRVGQPIGVFVGYETAGIVADSAQAAALGNVVNTVNGARYRPGDVLFVDQDGNDTINAADRTIIGSPHPDYTIGWQNTVTFRGFELSGLLTGTFGNEVLNLNLWRLTGGDLATNVLRERYTDRWTPDNPDARYPRFGVNTVGAGTTDYNDLILEDGSYIRLRSLSLAYSLPEGWVRGRGFSRARIYATGTNLVTWTDYRGFDPEVSSFGGGNLNRGIDIGSYPSSRSLTVGFNFAY